VRKIAAVGLIAIGAFAMWGVAVIWLLDLRDVLSALSKPGRLRIEDVGALGDSFGVVTSLFSALAFAAIVLTLLYQREEMRDMRAQMKGDRLSLLFNDQVSRLRECRNNLSIDVLGRSYVGSGAVFLAAGHVNEQVKKKSMRHGDTLPIDVVREVMRSLNDFELIQINNGLSDYVAIIKSSTELLFTIAPEDRAPLQMLFGSVLDTSDYIYLHYYFMANTDPPFHEQLAEVGFFEHIGPRVLLTMLNSGPYFHALAYGCGEDEFKIMVEKSAEIKKRQAPASKIQMPDSGTLI
jgi:hypothetical protein